MSAEVDRIYCLAVHADLIFIVLEKLGEAAVRELASVIDIGESAMCRNGQSRPISFAVFDPGNRTMFQ